MTECMEESIMFFNKLNLTFKKFKNYFQTMYNKKMLFFILILELIWTGGCVPLHENPPQQKLPDNKGFGDSKCLSDVFPVFKKFVQGQAQDPEIIAVWDCFGKVLTTFESSTRGSQDDRFTSKELANFVENYFLEETIISDRLLTEIFHIKQLFLGGKIDSLTRKEIKQLILLGGQLKNITLRLSPYMKVFSFNWQFDPRNLPENTIDKQVRFFESANLEVQTAAKELGQIIATNGMGYGLDNFIVLLEELSFLNHETWSFIEDIRLYMPLIKKLKKTLTGGDEGLISPLEWKRFALLGSRGFVQFLRYKYFLKDNNSSLNNELNKTKTGATPELTYIVRSIDDLFSYFGDMVSEKPDQVLTKSELLEIFQALEDIFPKVHISDALLTELMKIKRLFFGGSLDYWEQSDFEKARSKLENFRSLTVEFLSYVDVYGLSWDAKNDEGNTLVEAKIKLVDFAKRVGFIIETDYNLISLYILAEELDAFFKKMEWENKNTFTEFSEKYLPIIISIKNIISNDQDSVISLSQWPALLRLTSMGYGAFMDYHYYLKPEKKWETLKSQKNIYSIGTQIFTLMQNILENREIIGKQALPYSISYMEIKNLINQFKFAGFISIKISDNAIDHMVLFALDQLLITPEKRIKYGGFHVFDKDSVKWLSYYFGVWSQTQKAWIGQLESKNISDPVLTQEEWVQYLKNHPELVASKELLQFINSSLPFTLDNNKNLIIQPGAKIFNSYTLSLQNLSNIIIKWVIQSYAMDLNRIKNNSGITKDEAQKLYDDVKYFFIDLEYLDPANDKFAMNRLREANLFSPRANGDQLVDFLEGQDLMWMIMSGLEIDSRLYAGLELPEQTDKNSLGNSAADRGFKDSEKRCKINKKSIKSNWTVSLNCVTENYRATLGTQMSHLPGFLKFWNSLKTNQTKNSFLSDVFKSAGSIPNPEGTAKMGDIALVPHILQYIESIMQKYDVNDSGQMNTYEALEAYPVFKSILKDVSGQDSDKRLKGLFTWLLKYSKPPQTTMEKLDYAVVWCNKDPKNWDVNATRGTMASILGFIAEATADPVPSYLMVSE